MSTGRASKITHLDHYCYFWTTSVCICCHTFLYSWTNHNHIYRIYEGLSFLNFCVWW